MNLEPIPALINSTPVLQLALRLDLVFAISYIKIEL